MHLLILGFAFGMMTGVLLANNWTAIVAATTNIKQPEVEQKKEE